MLVQSESFPEFAHKNTYGIEAIPQDAYQDAMKNLTMPGGCQDRIKACRAAAKGGDSLGLGTNETVNKLCVDATLFCFDNVQGVYSMSGRNVFDITQLSPAIFPPEYSVGFFNQPWVQDALGVAVNFTLSADIVRQIMFGVTGDPVRAEISDLEYLLSRGVKLAMVYGDRDYRCNWVGAEKISLEMKYPSSEPFRAAGYAPISTNKDYQGGLVRQHGNVSFSRVFEAGHGVTAYQPETVLQIFERSMFGKDVATGKLSIDADGKYSSAGPVSVSDVKNEGAASPEPICFLMDALFTCAPNQLQALADGSAVIENFVVVSPKADVPEADASGGADQQEGQSAGLRSFHMSVVTLALATGIAVSSTVW